MLKLVDKEYVFIFVASYLGHTYNTNVIIYSVQKNTYETTSDFST